MTELQGAVLTDRAVVAVAGQPAREFLRGLVTIDVADVGPGTPRHGALLTPQGKILFEFIMVDGGAETILLDVAAPLAADLGKRLVFYRLRTKIEIAVRDDLAVAALWGGAATPAFEGASPDPRLAALGWRVILPAEEAAARIQEAGAALTDLAAYHAHRISHGVPELAQDYATGELFPHEADLDQLSGVDFDKGCFVGQEVVSRMQHRGTARKRFVPMAVSGALPEPGTAVTAGGRTLGETGQGAHGHALALIRLDRLGEALAKGHAIEAGAAKLTPRKPDWARFEWPGAGQ